MLQIKDTGKTPALDLSMLLPAEPPGRGLIRRFKFILAPLNRGVLRSGGTLTGSLPLIKNPDMEHADVPNQATIDKMKSGDMRLFIFGRITYRHVFNVEHLANFCLYLCQDLNAFATCDVYNDVDREKSLVTQLA